MSIIIFIVILLILVVVHEFGHFFTAKRFGIRVDEFGFGFPPKLFSKKLKLINASGKQLQDKISTYKSTCIIQWALIDIPAIFSLIGFLLTTNYAFLLLDILLIIVFTVLTPSKMKIIFQLRLNQQEAAQL